MAHLLTSPIASSGSNRIYTRETDANGQTVIKTVGISRAENHAFITLARHFEALNLPVPHVLWVSEDEMSYTQTDLGSVCLFDLLPHDQDNSANDFTAIKNLLEKTIRTLAHFQMEGARNCPWQVCYPVPAFDKRSIFWDLNYYKYCYLKVSGYEIDEPRLEDEFEKLSAELLVEDGVLSSAFMLRDCQSRNVMIVHDEPYFIDFQGGRRGPVYYDLASFLWQARAHYPQSLRDVMIAAYYDELLTIVAPHAIPTIDVFKEHLKLFVFFRQLQVLGAYGFRGVIERKEHFLKSLPLSEQNLKEFMETNRSIALRYPYIASLSNKGGL